MRLYICISSKFDCVAVFPCTFKEKETECPHDCGSIQTVKKLIGSDS